MAIEWNSPVHSGGSIPLNTIEKPVMWFTESSPKLYYIVFRWEDSKYRIMNTGEFIGYGNKYKFDFSPYIKIENQDFSEVDSNIFYKAYHFDNVSNVILAYKNTPFSLVEFPITEDDKGSYVIDLSPFSSFTIHNKKFYDREYGEVLFNPVDVLFEQEIITITSYTTAPIVTELKVGAVTYNKTLINNPNGAAVAVVKVPNGVSENDYIKVTYYGKTYTSKLRGGCRNNWLYWGLDGGLHVLRTDGNMNTQTKTDKKFIKKYVREVQYNKYIVQNTGLGLTETEMHSLITSPVVYNREFVPYIIDTSEFNGFNGLRVGEKNMELIFSEPRTYKRFTSKQNKFFE